MKLTRRQLRQLISEAAGKLSLNEQAKSVDAFKAKSAKTYERLTKAYEESDTMMGKLTAILSAVLDINVINMNDFMNHMKNPQPLLDKLNDEGLDAALAELLASDEL